MREIFFDEKLGETQRNSEGERAARAEMGCELWELCGQECDFWGRSSEGASRTGKDGSSGRGGVRAARARMGAVGVVRGMG